jgi:hypothetical protein
MKLISLTGLFGVLLASGCKPNANTPKSADYTTTINMRYMERDMKVHAEARFVSAVQGASVALPVTMQLNKTALRQLATTDGTYLYDGPSTAINGAQVFEWQSPVSEQNCSVSLAPALLKGLKFDETPLSHQKVARLSWSGEPITPQDALVLLWENTKTRATITTQAMTSSSVYFLELPAFEVKKVPAGNYQLTIIRKRFQETTQQGGLVRAQYEVYHKPIGVEVRS